MPLRLDASHFESQLMLAFSLAMTMATITSLPRDHSFAIAYQDAPFLCDYLTMVRVYFAIAFPCASFIDGYLTKMHVSFAIALSLERLSFAVHKYKKREVARSFS